jgi:phosphate starvation-inducible PhoH-like protein
MVKKMDPWTRPIFDIFEEYYSKSEITNMVLNGQIEISPLGFMRGRTFKNAFIIADEMQNSSPKQMYMLLTRIGINSRMVITGDLEQSDKLDNNGLKDLIIKINAYSKENTLNKIKLIELNNTDIQRSDIVESVINMYNYVAPKKTEIRSIVKKPKYIDPDTLIKKQTPISLNSDAALIPKKDYKQL